MDCIIYNMDLEADSDHICISWTGDIGWGEYNLYFRDGSWYADSECMDSGDDKEFLMVLLRKFVEDVTVEG